MLHDFDRVWEVLYQVIVNCANVVRLFKTMRVRPNKLPWITNDILVMLRDRDDAFLDAFMNNNPEMLKTARDLKTSSKKAIRVARSEFIQSQLQICKSNPKKFWSEIKNLTSKQSIQPSSHLQDENGLPINEERVADYINDFFATVSSKLASQFPEQTPNSTVQPNANSNVY